MKKIDTIWKKKQSFRATPAILGKWLSILSYQAVSGDLFHNEAHWKQLKATGSVLETGRH